MKPFTHFKIFHKYYGSILSIDYFKCLLKIKTGNICTFVLLNWLNYLKTFNDLQVQI